MASSALANEQGRRHRVPGLFFCPLTPAAHAAFIIPFRTPVRGGIDEKFSNQGAFMKVTLHLPMSLPGGIAYDFTTPAELRDFCLG